ncbi:Inner tegument protein [Dissostichus eleginoides]|uniref:Inner tegument protein n=1 Tax=Dissostichus eleginoides TaxID=100907 RepID=A0AAD9CPY7_DISEL|nr:Inner tegument protein [Dissostichus eleginoides]
MDRAAGSAAFLFRHSVAEKDSHLKSCFHIAFQITGSDGIFAKLRRCFHQSVGNRPQRQEIFGHIGSWMNVK